ncbi:glycoside hydrolase family 13 protein [Ruminococcaceae bacterium OttesenSCG-928-A16]|nr:glycoside hydrolase family 13 protein [Ruminococcaceae bacterium OttesenSCG-928-A16]
MNVQALQHRMSPWDTYSLARDQLTIRMRAARGELEHCTILYWPRNAPQPINTMEMSVVLQDDLFDYYETTLHFSTAASYIKYCFLLQTKQGERLYYSSTSIQPKLPSDGYFEHLYTNAGDVITTPAWAKGIVYYQIFVDRFNRDPKHTPKRELQNWGAKPDREHYMGGNLKGILGQLDYLEKLGVGCLYLTPIFEADFNHKYATINYYEVDPDFGTKEDLVALIKECHRRDIRILLDGVFNHCGIDFPPFKDVLQNQQDSKYTDWFYIKKYPVTISEECYECVGDYLYMPKLNTSNREVRQYILDIMKHWLTVGIDGWRLDVADEVDYSVWEYAHVEIKDAFPDALLLGESWGDAGKMLSGRQLDTVMNYLFRDAMLGFFAHDTLDATGLAARLGSILSRYHSVTNHLLYNLLDSHDTPRFLTECEGNIDCLKLAVAFQMLYLGCPAVYYGDEIGILGENDPDSRRCMPWTKSKWNKPLLDWYRQLIRIRKENIAIQEGAFYTVLCQGDVYAFARTVPGQEIYIVFNRSSSAQIVSLPVKTQGEYRELLTDYVLQTKPFIPENKIDDQEILNYSGSVKIPLHAMDVKILKHM